MDKSIRRIDMVNNKKTNNDDNPCCSKFWEIHTTACELISFSMRYPSQTLYEAVSTGEWKEAVCEIWTLLNLEISDDFMADLTNAQKVDYHDLRVEATELFVCHPSAKCSPYETHWRSEGKGIRPLMFVSPYSMDVERFCHSCGLTQSKEWINEPLDHIATEFELLQYLASIESGMWVPTDQESAIHDFPGGSASAAFELFCNDHIFTFAPQLAQKIQQEAHTSFYKAVGKMIELYVVALKEGLI